MVYKEEKRDLFSVDNDYYLAHCISADFKLGAGIAKEFERRFNLREDLLFAFGEKWYEEYGNTTDGDVLLHGKKRVIDLVTKTRYWHKPSIYTMECCLKKMRDGCVKNGIKKIAMPKIGCGLDKLKWEDVSALIQEVFQNTDIEILVCYL